MKKILLAMIAIMGMAQAGDNYSKTIKYADELMCKITHYGKMIKGANKFHMSKMNDIEQDFYYYDISNNGRKLMNGKVNFTYTHATVDTGMVYKHNEYDMNLELLRNDGNNENPYYDLHIYTEDNAKYFGGCITISKK